MTAKMPDLETAMTRLKKHGSFTETLRSYTHTYTHSHTYTYTHTRTHTRTRSVYSEVKAQRIHSGL